MKEILLVFCGYIFIVFDSLVAATRQNEQNSFILENNSRHVHIQGFISSISVAVKIG